MARLNSPAADTIKVGFLIALFMAAIIIMAVSGLTQSTYRIDDQVNRDPSIFDTRTYGSQGFFEFVNRIGYSTQVWKHDWSELPDNASVLISIDPETSDADDAPVSSDDSGDQSSRLTGANSLSSADARGLRSWLQKGHTAILMVTSLSPAALSGATEKYGFSDVLGVSVQSPTYDKSQTDFAPMQPISLTRNVVSVHASDPWRVHIQVKTLAALPLFGDVIVNPVTKMAECEPYAVLIPCGEGKLIIIADSAFASNANLGQGDNAVFLANILKSSARPNDTVLFDEYHHGESDSNGGLWEAIGRPMQMATVQLVLAMFVLFAAVAPRFGRPLPMNATTQRTSAEYVASLAALYAGGKATTAALEPIYRQFLRDTCISVGVPVDITLDRLAQIAARGKGVSESRMRNILARCERAVAQQHLSEPDMVDIVRELEQLRKELKIV